MGLAVLSLQGETTYEECWDSLTSVLADDSGCIFAPKITASQRLRTGLFKPWPRALGGC